MMKLKLKSLLGVVLTLFTMLKRGVTKKTACLMNTIYYRTLHRSVRCTFDLTTLPPLQKRGGGGEYL